MCPFNAIVFYGVLFHLLLAELIVILLSSPHQFQMVQRMKQKQKKRELKRRRKRTRERRNNPKERHPLKHRMIQRKFRLFSCFKTEPVKSYMTGDVFFGAPYTEVFDPFNSNDR